MKFLPGIPEGVPIRLLPVVLYGFQLGRCWKNLRQHLVDKNLCIGGKYFFNPSMQYIMGLIEALGYITSGTSGRGWSFKRAPTKAPIGCLLFVNRMDTRIHDIIDLLD